MPDKSSEDLLREALDTQSVTDPMIRAGLAAIAMGESKMRGYTEQGYAHTSNARIRQVFGRRVAGLSDDELTALKASNRNFFNWVYGAQFEHIHHLGNTQPDDGLNFRGRGFIQLTGRANYTRYSHKIGRPDILVNPDLANDPEMKKPACGPAFSLVSSRRLSRPANTRTVSGRRKRRYIGAPILCATSRYFSMTLPRSRRKRSLSILSCVP